MVNLLSAGFSRLWKDKAFWFGTFTMFVWAVIMLVAGYFTGSRETVPLEQYFFQYALLSGGFCAVFIGLFLGTDYSDGTIRNKVLVGYSRVAIYLSNFIVSVSASMIMVTAWIFAMLIIGVPLFGWFVSNLVTIMLYLLISVLMVVAFSAIFTLISMINHNKASVVVITILTFFGLLFLASYCENRLQEPEMYGDGIVIDTTGGLGSISARLREAEPNPDYVRGTLRKLYEFGVAFLPSGQGIRLSNMGVEQSNYQDMPFYSLIIIITTSYVGVILFKRKDLN